MQKEENKAKIEKQNVNLFRNGSGSNRESSERINLPYFKPTVYDNSSLIKKLKSTNLSFGHELPDSNASTSNQAYEVKDSNSTFSTY
jgi:hypothetical protein